MSEVTVRERLIAMGLGFIIERFGYRLLGRHDYEFLDELRGTQWLSAAELRDLQLVYLKSLIRYVYAWVPFYRKWMQENGVTPDDIQSVGDITVFPIVDKCFIKAHYQEFVAERPRGRVFYGQTSGSTGTPFRYIRDPLGYSYSRAVALRMYEMAGFELGQRWVDITGNIIRLNRGPSLIRQKAVKCLRNFMELPAWNMNSESMTRMVMTLNRFKPAMIRGYASALYLLARHIQLNGGLEFKPKVVVSYAETLFDHQRREIETAFDAPVRNTYGCSEGNIAGECSYGKMHIAVENVIVEQDRHFLTDDGLEVGELLLTFLHTHSFPFIRYRIGDWGTVSSFAQCECGRQLPVLANVIGRTSDFLTTPDGRVFSSPGVENWFREIAPLIAEFQIVQESISHATLSIVPDVRGFDSHAMNEFLAKLRSQVAPLVLELKIVDRLPLPPSGKRRPVISLVNNPLFAMGENASNGRK